MTPCVEACANTDDSCPSVCDIAPVHILDSELLLDRVPCWLLYFLFPPPVLLADYSGDAKKKALLTGGRQGRRASDCRQGAISCQVLFRPRELPILRPSSSSLQTKLLALDCITR